MGTYAAAVSRTETSTIYVESATEADAQRVAEEEADEGWDAETINTQVDSVTELSEDEASQVSSYVIREDA